MQISSQCPCGLESDYESCCERYHLGAAIAPTAEVLMRSRYSAYVRGHVDYLVSSTHPSARTKNLADAYRQTSDSIQWIGLEVYSTSQGGEGDQTGKVEFKATYLHSGDSAVHHEHSRFKRHSGKWHYFDGVVSDRSLS